MSKSDGGRGGGVNIGGVVGSVSGDIVGGDKITLGPRPSLNLFRAEALKSKMTSPAAQLSPYERRASFVGREVEIESLRVWLDAPSIISIRTIVGLPGIGKTRLAVELADVAEKIGWSSGFLRGRELQRFINGPNPAEWGWDQSALVIVDYAAQKLDALHSWVELLQDLSNRDGVQSKLRVLLIERTATQLSWWTQVFGAGGKWSDCRLALCDPPEPVELKPISKRALELQILSSAPGTRESSGTSQEAILARIYRSRDAAQVLGNPLMLQIAAANAPRDADETTTSRASLLDMVVKRESMAMREEWLRIGAPGFALRDLQWLVAAVTLLQGATLEGVFRLLDEGRHFANLTSAVGKTRVQELLNAVLIGDEEFGVRGLEPDLIGDLYVLRSELPTEAVVGVFKTDHLAVGPRLWRMLADFRSDAAAEATISTWIGAVANAIEDTLRLDVFLSERPGNLPVATAAMVAEAHSKIAEGLKRGDQTQESLLLSAGHRDELVAKELIRAAYALETTERYADAVAKLEAAHAILEKASHDPDDLLWLHLYRCQANCHRAMGEAAPALSAIDQAIELCKRRIATDRLSERAFLQQTERKLIDAITDQGSVLSPRGLQLITSLGGIKDIRLTLAELIHERLGHGSLATTEVRSAITHLEDMLAGDTSNRIRDDALYLKEASERLSRKGLKELAEICRRAHFDRSQAATELRANAVILTLALRKFVIGSQGGNNERQSAETKTALRDFIAFAGEGEGLRAGHLVQLGFCLVFGYPAFRGQESPPHLRERVVLIAIAVGDGRETLEELEELARVVSILAHDCGLRDAEDYDSVVADKAREMMLHAG